MYNQPIFGPYGGSPVVGPPPGSMPGLTARQGPPTLPGLLGQPQGAIGNLGGVGPIASLGGSVGNLPPALSTGLFLHRMMGQMKPPGGSARPHPVIHQPVVVRPKQPVQAGPHMPYQPYLSMGM